MDAVDKTEAPPGKTVNEAELPEGTGAVERGRQQLAYLGPELILAARRVEPLPSQMAGNIEVGVVYPEWTTKLQGWYGEALTETGQAM